MVQYQKYYLCKPFFIITNNETMKITYYGHSCFLLEIMDYKILVDPFITGNPLAADKVKIDSIKCDYIMATHAHADHVADLERVAKNNPDALLISNFEIVEYYNNLGINGYPMNVGGRRKFDFGKVKCVTAVHSSSFADGSNGGLAMGFIITSDAGNIYIAGDTALTMDMKLVAEFTPQLRAAILPIGDNFTMGFDDALKAANYVGAGQVIGCHFDTSPFIEIDHDEAMQRFESGGMDLIIPTIGETYIV